MGIQETVWVELAENKYPIWVGTGLLDQAGELIRSIAADVEKILLVTNDLVYGLYGEQVTQSLERAGFCVHTAVLPDGEGTKSLTWAEKLYEAAILGGLDRSSLVIALGGGVVGDLAGFVAATYMRGVRFIQIPTTLLAQVDSSVGGKVAINHRLGKNLIGAFHQPKAVICDLDTLRTLPYRQLLNGMAEVIKHGIIGDKQLLELIETAEEPTNNAFLRTCIMRSLRLKAEIVARDEKEANIRAILNFGHTIGHGIEQAAGFGRYTHGEAVVMGMIGALHISVELGLLQSSERDRITAIFHRYGYPLAASSCSSNQVLTAMRRDKKNRGGKFRFVLIERIGSPVIYDAVPVNVIEKALTLVTSQVGESN